tara:strand:+ start:54967 stop:55233 length:267 start_codon:yes stop_codon:yes gene_type:complete
MKTALLPPSVMPTKRWTKINMEDEVFETLWNAQIIHYQNLVYAIRPFTPNSIPITINIPFNRYITLRDFTIVGANGEIQSAINNKDIT